MHPQNDQQTSYPSLTTRETKNEPTRPKPTVLAVDVTMPHLPSVPTGLNEHLADQLETSCNFCSQITHHVHEGEIQGQNNKVCNTDQHNYYYNHIT